MDTVEKQFKRLFPNLAKELDVKNNTVILNAVRLDSKNGEKISQFSRYVPDVVDFIRRCDNAEQVEEIIQYLKKRGEITLEYANKIREQLKKMGLRSFGPKKEEDYYLKHGTI